MCAKSSPLLIYLSTKLTAWLSPSQDTVSLGDSTALKCNLDSFGVLSDGDCQHALETVCLWPFATECEAQYGPFSFDTLSQGQKQFISLARAIQRRRIRERDSPEGRKGILLLVDLSTHHDMHLIIREEFQEYTIVIVSHRLETVMDFDTVWLWTRAAWLRSELKKKGVGLKNCGWLGSAYGVDQYVY
jgi:ABC-type transport system involved in cytochrome bd biosynthesis fused ATPase/permease subunit